MRIGVPQEIKNHEYRVGMRRGARGGAPWPRGAGEAGAGAGIGCDDDSYAQAGAQVLPDAAAVFEAAEIREGRGAATGRVRHAAQRPDPVHVPAPRARPRTGRGPAPERLHRDRLRKPSPTIAAACRCSRRWAKSRAAWPPCAPHACRPRRPRSRPPWPGATPGTPPSSTPRPPWAFCSAYGADLDRHATGDFASSAPAAAGRRVVGDGFVGDHGAAALDAGLGLLGSGARCRYVNRIWPSRSIAHSAGCGSLTLTIMSAAAKTCGGVRQHLAPAWRVAVVVAADAGAGAGLHQHVVAVVHGLAHRRRRHADAVLVILDFLGDADSHGDELRGWGAHRGVYAVEEAFNPWHRKPEVCARIFEEGPRITVDGRNSWGFDA